MTEKEIVTILEGRGPLTGAQLVECTGVEVLALWHLCKRSSSILLEQVGRQFLRLDRAVPGYARLSPSIRREFLTYTLLGLESHAARFAEATNSLRAEIRRISVNKRALAKSSMDSVIEELPDAEVVRRKACFIIAGDITYEMSHTVPRPEQSTGEMVRGSDLDIVIVTEDDLPPDLRQSLDRAIYRKKHFLLTHPDYREEIDYLVKGVDKVREQLTFGSFEFMVASKILDEGEFLCGSLILFETVKRLVSESGIPGKLRALECQAVLSRQQAEERLLDLGAELPEAEAHHLFYTREESEEIY
jgi:hypothetical protein